MITRRNLLLALVLVAGNRQEAAAQQSGTGSDFGVSDEFPFWRKRLDGQHTGSQAFPPRPETDGRPARAAFTEVRVPAGYVSGSIIINTTGRALYYVMPGAKALRYDIGVGREGSEFRGSAVVGRKAEWPDWRPTEAMLKRDPERYRSVADGIGGGPDNPLGARALYLFLDGRDTLFRIHGTNRPETVGTASSAGCIRMRNADVIDLYDRVPLGARVFVQQD